MFDDVKKGAPPANLPTVNKSEEEPVAQSITEPPAEIDVPVMQNVPDDGVDDMFADTNLGTPAGAPPIEQQAPIDELLLKQTGSSFPWIRLVIVVVLVAAILVGILYFGARLFSGGQNQEQPTAPAPEQPTQPAPVQPDTQVLDTDRDQLTDDEERALGTNVAAADSDNDGLSDYQEVRIYFSNPLNADTDGDSYSDGAEVQNGYSPTGPGRLLELPNS